jgi:hypothetical protein
MPNLILHTCYHPDSPGKFLFFDPVRVEKMVPAACRSVFTGKGLSTYAWESALRGVFRFARFFPDPFRICHQSPAPDSGADHQPCTDYNNIL